MHLAVVMNHSMYIDTSAYCRAPPGRDETVFAISVWPIRLTGSGVQCILGQTVVDFTKKASPVDGLPGHSHECRML